ncbi:MAG: hypothetical protein JWM53_5177 [bacterium]|jgi:hypothetical protein|nr:hypothetical protein [bacterium]
MTNDLGQRIRIPNIPRPTGVSAALFAVAAVAVILGTILTSIGHPGAFAPAIIAAAVALSLALPWRVCLFAIPLLLLVEALARRYVVNEVALFLVKDAVLAVAYVKYAVARYRAGRKIVPRTLVTWPIAVFAVIVVAEALNPTLPSPLVGVFGIYSWLWYAPICWLVAEAFPTPTAAIRAAAVYLAISVPLGVLAQVQQHVPAANRSYYDAVVGSTSFVYHGRIIASRSVGTFASTNAFGDYLIIVAVLLFACAVLVRNTSTFVALCVVLVAFVLAVGGAANRSASGAAFVSMITVIVIHKRRDRGTAVALAFGVAFLLALALLPPVFPGLDRAGGTGFSPASLSQRLTDHLYLPVEKVFGVDHQASTAKPNPSLPTKARSSKPVPPSSTQTQTSAPTPAPTGGWTAILGHGAGLGAGGLQYVANLFLSASDQRRTRELGGPEGGWADVLWELGLPGLIPLIWLFVVVAATAVRVRRSIDDTAVQSLAGIGAAAVASTAFLMLVSSKLTHPVFAVLFWFTVGLTLAADRLAREAA